MKKLKRNKLFLAGILCCSIIAISMLIETKNDSVISNEKKQMEIITPVVSKQNNQIKNDYIMVSRPEIAIKVENTIASEENDSIIDVLPESDMEINQVASNNKEEIINNNEINEESNDLTLFGKEETIQTIEPTITPIIELTNQEKFEQAIDSIDDTLSTYDWFLEYKSILEEYSFYEDVELPRTIYDDFTEKELEVMFRCVETEVYEADFDSKINVASVIFNRYRHDRFPDDMMTIITSPRQFAYYRTEITETSILALEYAYLIGDTTGGCIAFRSDIAPEKWYDWTYQFTDKAGHNFYID